MIQCMVGSGISKAVTGYTGLRLPGLVLKPFPSVLSLEVTIIGRGRFLRMLLFRCCKGDNQATRTSSRSLRRTKEEGIITSIRRSYLCDEKKRAQELD
jgi:hypothetical protein